MCQKYKQHKDVKFLTQHFTWRKNDHKYTTTEWRSDDNTVNTHDMALLLLQYTVMQVVEEHTTTEEVHFLCIVGPFV